MYFLRYEQKFKIQTRLILNDIDNILNCQKQFTMWLIF